MEKDGKQLQAITDAWHTRQDFYHICGTIALLHVLGNVQAPLKAGSALATFYADTKNDDSASRCSKLRQNEAIATAHTKYASLGDSVIPEPDEVSAHYVALVPLNGRIIDLNGAAKYPMDRGPTAGDFLAVCLIRSLLEGLQGSFWFSNRYVLLQDAAAYVKSEILPHVIHNELNLLALVGGSS